MLRSPSSEALCGLVAIRHIPMCLMAQVAHALRATRQLGEAGGGEPRLVNQSLG